MNIVLVEPEIPPNTGNVARLCAAARATLHLVEPFGFKLDDARLKRAALDYWRRLKWHRWPDWTAFQSRLPAGARLWLIESKGPRHYAQARYQPDDFLVFGRETAGLPAEIMARYPDSWLRIPMFDTYARSLNLSNCVALVLYEALRQQGFAGEIRPDSPPI
jgi:tRNA (cytidine/uridine-2'-O-)-methyltransferase